VIYGGVDLEKFRMRESLEHDGSVVFLGRILPHKGIHFLIDSLPPGHQLHVIGTVADRDYFSSLQTKAAGKRVDFLTDLGDREVVALLQRAMALVHPTPVDADGFAGANELLGLAVLEAMACGCPAVASRTASLPELVDDGVTGLLVSPNEAACIEGALRRLDSDRSSWSSMALAGRQRIVDRYSWVHVAGRCVDAYGASWQPRAEGVTCA
jgi:glycosyltransferase involved in cell wall biosynthesis